MTSHARNIIDAIQHSLLGDLIWRWLTAVAITTLILSNAVEVRAWSEVLSMSVWLGLAVWVFLAWLLGALANRLPAPQGALQRVHPRHANGFAAWSELPADGLRPPRFMRALVMIVAGPVRWVFLPVLAIFVFCLFAIVAPDTAGRALGLDVGDPDIRLRLGWTGVAAWMTLQILPWAAHQRRMLLAQDAAAA